MRAISLADAARVPEGIGHERRLAVPPEQELHVEDDKVGVPFGDRDEPAVERGFDALERMAMGQIGETERPAVTGEEAVRALALALAVDEAA